jgi:hemerythrin-like metal-binding protein
MGVNFFKWDKTYNTGITKIDIQHKVIIKVLNELYNVVMINNKEEKLDDIINELVQYTKYHFNEEEILMKRINFPIEEDHIKKHNDFIEKIKEIIERRKKGDNFIAIDIINFLKDWLIDHILVEDKKYAEYIIIKNINI